MSRLSESVTRVMQILDGSDLGADYTVAQLLDETTARRSLDLSDLSPQEQAALVEGRAINMIPSASALAEKITAAQTAGRPFVVKYGIDPTSPDVHLGHAVPIIIASRLQRMGHHVVFIIGDVTAKIGDPSGRSSERPALTDDDITRNLSTYQQQVTPFIDFKRADLRFNGEWLNKVSLPQLVKILARVPVSMSLQRDDFRTRLAEGQGLSVAEFVYSVVMAMDSVAITADVELGGVDQLLNLQMCRKVMEISEQTPEIVITTPLIEGTDGTGAKMSKSKGNYVALTATPDDVYGRLMSIPDHVVEPYLKLLTEWTDDEIRVVTKRLEEGTAHPMAIKRILAGEVVAALHGLDAAAAARAEFTARFSKRSFGDTQNLPVVSLKDHAEDTLGALISRTLDFAPSISAVRRVAQQNGLRLIRESDGEQQSTQLTEASVQQALSAVVSEVGALDGAELYLKVGRKVARIEA
ncbi:tyrosine--tRNA ligase [Streptomyces sp. H27-H1]|uniref:tyrosine--tRNA ligase n=1 Tax=unclassified Streptomyces TaxID=2593676 RepID=UPI00226FF169|nr:MULTISPECIES: tyrosine--tRNA ligase [unclassified Streptomyces]MCY0926972.1 tyrosine--tRNA ligase [Streptomyces sp. H27-H1]MCY0933236.1 tyrosine--tRNA ligase [Streptomyces sp. H34-S4]